MLIQKDRESSLSRREVDELIDSIVTQPTASQKVMVNFGQEEVGPKPCVAHTTNVATNRC